MDLREKQGKERGEQRMEVQLSGTLVVLSNTSCDLLQLFCGSSLRFARCFGPSFDDAAPLASSASSCPQKLILQRIIIAGLLPAHQERKKHMATLASQ